MKQAAEDVCAVLPWRHGAGPSAVVSAAPAPQALEELLLRAAPCAVHHRVPLHIIQQIFFILGWFPHSLHYPSMLQCCVPKKGHPQPS